MDRPLSMTTGFDKFLMNIGEVKNHGVELEINSTNISNKNFSWNTTFNLGHNKNKVVRLDGVQTEIVSGSQIRKVGMPYRTFYLIEFAGIKPVFLSSIPISRTPTAALIRQSLKIPVKLTVLLQNMQIL